MKTLFKNLPLGARFTYSRTNDVFVKITPSTAAEWDDEKAIKSPYYAWADQGVYSFDLDEIVFMQL
jgi:hypothetical protein